MSLLDRLRMLMRRPEFRHIALSFEFGRSADNRHLVRVCRLKDGHLLPVEDLDQLAWYGYREEELHADGRLIIYTVEDSDRQLLIGLTSLNPEILPDKRLAFPFIPPMLQFVRRKENVTETKRSSKLVIDAEPLVPRATIHYDPAEGLVVKTGYSIPGSAKLIPRTELSVTQDGGFVQAGDNLAPIGEPKDARLRAWLNRPHQVFRGDEIPEFFERDFVLLRSQFSAVLAGQAQQIQVIDQPFEPFVQLDASVPGWLDYNVGYSVGDFTLDHRALQSHSGAFIQADAFTWIKRQTNTVGATERKLQGLKGSSTDNGYRVPVLEFVSLEEFIASIGGRAELSSAYRDFLAQLTDFATNDQYLLAPEAESDLQREGIALRPYQRAGIHWLDWLNQNQLHGLLADDMGLGKTLQTIASMRAAYERTDSQQSSLILAPKSVLVHWQREMRRFYPGMPVTLYHGSQRHSLLRQRRDPMVFVTTYDTAANDVDKLKKIPFFFCVLDEATHIKNPDTKRAQAIKSINAAHRVALSGTPVENRPSELWSVFDFLMQGYLGQYGTFKRVFEDGIGQGNQHDISKLGRKIRPFILRRLKEDVAKDLPEKVLMDEWCQLSAEQRSLYSSFQNQMDEISSALQRGEEVSYPTHILPLLTKLKQICDHPAIVNYRRHPVLERSEKFDWIVDRIGEIVAANEQVAVFSQFLGMLDLLGMALPSRVGRIRIDGSTRDRQSLVDRFNAGQAQVALLSLRAAGHGINLTAANHVIHADRWWNPAVEDQATDRVHRIGQNKTVFVYRIMVENTLEERIEKLLEKKRGIAGDIIDAATQDEHAWTREELLEILRPLD